MKWEEREESKLYRESNLTSFFSISPLDPEGALKSRKQLEGRVFWRNELADILERYNRMIGNDMVAMQQVEAFRQDESVCVMTGQQLGLFGGPAYTILKAISCLIVARKHHAVPIFWLATEDHDVDEIDHTYLLDTLGNLNKVHLSLPKDGQFVEDLQLTPRHHEVINRFFGSVDQKSLGLSIRGETSYCRAMARLLTSLFQGTGMVFLEPHLLRPLAKSLFRKEIKHSEEISSILQNTTQKLKKAGGESVLEIDQGTNLFLKIDGKYRRKIQEEKGVFTVGKLTFTKEELLQLIEDEPERFSTNAQARCVLQNTLFPVLAYIAGPGELGYYHQLGDYHRFHNLSVPWIVPRLSATIITPQAEQMLEQCRVLPWEEIPHRWSQIIPNIEEGSTELIQEWLQSAMQHFGEDLSNESMSRFIRYQSSKLQRKVTMSRLRKQGIAPYSLHYLHNLIYPHEKPQERILNWWEFQSHTSESIIQEFLNQLSDIPQGHLYCYL